MTLDQYLKGLKNEPLKKIISILDIVSQLVMCLKMVHSSGYIFNDLKPENVAVNIEDGKAVATLIDLGLASNFRYLDGSHLKSEEMTTSFNGNIMFSSVDSMKFYKTSRKDDMISLFYMMIILMNDNKMVGEE